MINRVVKAVQVIVIPVDRHAIQVVVVETQVGGPVNRFLRRRCFESHEVAAGK
uniref:hypothetical protein n=1 Tax=Levilactobacillus yiduensis TaxID=2953880 RepID=UPI00358F4E1F